MVEAVRTEMYYPSGSLHTETWTLPGSLRKHRDSDLPAWIEYRDDGSLANEFWYTNGKPHRAHDLPAVIYYSKKSCDNL